MKPIPLKILMLEDTKEEAEMIQRTLQKSGLSCEFKVMMTADAFIKALDEFRPDIILSDNAMPQFTASEALVIRQQQAPHIPFILVTGTVSEEFAAGIIKAGADDYLIKDRLTRLPAAIEAAIKQKQTEKEKNKAAEQLQHSEEQYRTLIEQASDGIFIADPTGKYIDVNESGCKALGYAKEEILQLAIQDLVVMDNDPVPSRLDEVNADTAIIQQRKLRKKNGALLPTEISAKKLRNGNYFAIVRDLTKRIEAEEKLRQSEEEYRTMMERVTDGFVAIDTNSCYTYVNPKAGALVGRKPEDLVGKNIWTEFPEGIGGRFYKAYYKAIEEQQYSYLQDYYAHFNTWLEIHIYPSPDGATTIYFSDVTEKKKAEQKILKANRLYLFISQINQMIVRVTDEATLFKEVCRIAVELGQFKMAWIGIIDGQTKKVVPVMYAGEEKGYLSKIKSISVDETKEDEGPAGTALREDKYIVCNDTENDERMQPWKEAALGREYYSSMSLPIKKFGKVVGALSVYAGEKVFFDATEIALLREAVGDVSFAMENFEKEALRKKAEEGVKLSEEKYMSLVNTVDGIVWEADAVTFEFNFVSKQAERLLGYATDEWLNNPTFWANHIYEDDRNWAVEFCKSSTLAKKPHEFEYRMIAADGRIVWLRDIVSVILENDSPVKLRGLMIDITKHKKTEEAIVESEKRYHTLAEISPVGIFHTDAEGATTYVNPKWCQISNLSYSEALGNGWLNAVHEEDREQLAKNWDDATKKSALSTSEYRFKRPDGSIAWVLGQAIPEKNIANEVIGYVGTITDITELKKAEEEIVKEKELSDKIINSMPGIFYLSNPAPKLVRWNNALEKISGFKKEELEEIIPATLFDPEDHRILRQGLERSYKKGSAEVEIRLLSKTGHRIPFYFTGVSIEYKGKPAVLGIGIDISELKKAEEEIKKSNERFELIAKATHDGLWDWNLETDELWGNEVHQQLYGLTMADPVPNHEAWKQRIHPEDREKTLQALEDAKASGQHSYVDEYRFYTENNGWMDVYGRTLIERNKQGKPVRLVGSMMDITERKKAAEEIKESEEKYRTLVEQASDGIFIADDTGKFIIVNSSACKLSGYNTAELAELTIYDIVHPESLASNPFRFEDMMQPQGARSERKMIRKDGVILDIEISAKFLSDKRFIAFVRDISERIKAEQSIKFSEEKYRSLVEQASDAIFISDKDGRFITINPSGCKLSQYSEAELMQMTIFDFFIEEDIKRNPIQFEALNQGKTVRSERIMKRKDGGVNHVEITAKILNDGKLLSFVRDISDIIKARNEIIKEKNLSDSIINSLPGVFYLYNKQGKFLRWNTNFEKVSLYNAEEIRQMHPLDFFTDNEKALLAQKIGNVFISGEDEVQADFLLKNKEKIPYYFTGIAIDYEGETCLMGVGIDFSERKKAQEEIETTTEKLRELTAHLLSVREEERKRIGREIHDELGQQLTAIKMDVSWIDKKTPEATTLIKNKLKNIITLLDGSNQSIRRILSELRPGILDDYGLIEALEWQNRQFTFNTGIPVDFVTTERELKLPEPLATCIFRVYQEAFTNITRHAIATEVTASLTVANDTITVVIEDNGKGFEAGVNGGKKSFGILGMKERVLAQGGNFELFSAPGKGTRMEIQLPYLFNKDILN